jgi:hypothetical protein
MIYCQFTIIYNKIETDLIHSIQELLTGRRFYVYFFITLTAYFNFF